MILHTIKNISNKTLLLSTERLSYVLLKRKKMPLIFNQLKTVHFGTFQRLIGLTGQTGSVIDGVLTCTYKQSTTVTANQSQIKDLNTDRYLLVATGPSSNGE